MKIKSSLLIIFLNSFILLHAQQVVLSPVTTSLTAPVDIKNAGDRRLFIVERAGTIRILDSAGMLQPLPFLNIISSVKSFGEQGCLGLAFDPDFKQNGFFYVYYTRHTDSAIVVSRFHLTGDPNHCDSTTEQKLLVIHHPYANHNGGSLNFGPDGYLYIGTGDGGNGGDPGNRAQNIDSLLGKILRIDVSDSSVPYKIPPDNPFVGKAGRDEIWDYGLRNPWRFSFDRQTDEIWIADVGQNKYEEIDREPANSGGGINYGWRCYEGDSTYNTTGCGVASLYTFPVYAYDHGGNNCSITGGYRYRGMQFPAFTGKYFFADYCVAQIRYLTETGPGIYTNTLTNASLPDMVTFGEDVNGELYVATIGGNGVYRLCDASCLTEINEKSDAGKLTIYPNPNDGKCMLSFHSESAQIKSIIIHDVFGQSVYEHSEYVKEGDNNIPVSLKNSSTGIYFLIIKGRHEMIVKKLVVR